MTKAVEKKKKERQELEIREVSEDKSPEPEKKQKKEQKHAKGTLCKRLGVAAGLTGWVLVSWFLAQFIVAFVIMMPATAIFGDNMLLNNTTYAPVWTLAISILVSVLAIILMIFVPKLVFKKFKTTREEMGASGLPTWTDIGLAPLGFAAYIIIANILVALMTMFTWFNAEQQQITGFEGIMSMSDRLLAFATIVVVAPIAEELIFRGWLYGKLRAKVNVWVSILFTSVLFALLHYGAFEAIQWNVIVNVFGMSIVLCALREITGTVWSAVIMHMLKNAIAFYFVFIVMM
jgi:hypothetical protein